MSELIRLPVEGDLVAGKYRLMDEIGRGGFGVVFQAMQEGINRSVAVKMLLPHAMSHDGVVERFKREAHLAGSLSHPNTVKIFDTGIYTPAPNIKALPYIAMEYLEGETLQGYLFRHQRLRLEDAMDILLQILGSLGEAHTKGVVHRDLKPENIFLCNRNVEERLVKVLDFGIAKAIDGDWDNETRERLTRTGMVAGTAEYMAPEQASGETDITPALDVYAVGCLAFQMLAGKVPFEGKSPMDVAIKHISDPLPDLPETYRGQFIEKLIPIAMAKNPLHRFANAREFGEALRSGELPDNLYEEHGQTDERPAVLDYSEEAPTRAMGIPMMEDPSSADTNLWSNDEPETIDLDAAIEPSPGKTRISTVILAAIAVVFIMIFSGVAGIVGYNTLFGDDAPSAISPPDDKGADKKAPEAVAKKADDPEGKGENPTADKADGDKKGPSIEFDDTPDLMLASAVEIKSKPSRAEVWRGDENLGRTPLTVEREEGQTRVNLKLRTRRAAVTYTLDWTRVEDGEAITVPLRKRKPTANKGGAGPVADKSPNKGNAADKGTPTNKGNNGGSGVLFKPKTPRLDPKKSD